MILIEDVYGAEDKEARLCKKSVGPLFLDLKRVSMAGNNGRTSHMANSPARTVSPARLSKDG